VPLVPLVPLLPEDDPGHSSSMLSAAASALQLFPSRQVICSAVAPPPQICAQAWLICSLGAWHEVPFVWQRVEQSACVTGAEPDVPEELPDAPEEVPDGELESPAEEQAATLTRPSTTTKVFFKRFIEASCR